MDIDPKTHTFSREEMQFLARERVNEIAKEFSAGFELLSEYPKSVTFFGSAAMDEKNPYCLKAKELAGRIVKELGHTVITGGGPGIMEAANRGAYEAGGNSVGLTIELPQPQIINKFLTREFNPYYFFVRKVLLSFSSEAFIFFPGGYGTLDEFFEVLTLIQTRKITDVPLICVGADYWRALERFIQTEILTRGAILPEDLLLFTITDNHDEVLDIIAKAPKRDIAHFHLLNERVVPIRGDGTTKA